MVEKVGIRLTIRKVTITNKTAQKALERTNQLSYGKSKEIIIGIIHKAAAEGAGPPTKK